MLEGQAGELSPRTLSADPVPPQGRRRRLQNPLQQQGPCRMEGCHPNLKPLQRSRAQPHTIVLLSQQVPKILDAKRLAPPAVARPGRGQDQEGTRANCQRVAPAPMPQPARFTRIPSSQFLRMWLVALILGQEVAPVGAKAGGSGAPLGSTSSRSGKCRLRSQGDTRSSARCPIQQIWRRPGRAAAPSL